jgi:hypothetical protein
MTNKKKELSQLTIFEWCKRKAEEQHAPLAATPGSLDINKELQAAMTEDIRHAADSSGRELSRYEIAGRMSELLGEDITKTTLDNWTAQSHPHSIPAHQLPAFVVATGGQRRSAEVIAKHSGLFLLPGADALRSEIRRLEEEITRKQQERQKRITFLKEIED